MSNRLEELLAERAGGPSKEYTTNVGGVRKTVMPRKDPESGRLNWRGMDERPQSAEELHNFIKNAKYQLKHGRRGRPLSQATTENLKRQINLAQTKLSQMERGVGTKRFSKNKRTAWAKGETLGRPMGSKDKDDSRAYNKWLKTHAEEYILQNELEPLYESFLNEGFNDDEIENILINEGLLEHLIEEEAQLYMIISEMVEDGLSDEEIVDIIMNSDNEEEII